MSEEMDRAAFGRFINRVGMMLEFVPEPKETKLVGLLRASLPRYDPARDPEVQLAEEINKMYLFLGESKSRVLLQICREIHVEIDEKMTKPDADLLWEELQHLHQNWYEGSIEV